MIRETLRELAVRYRARRLDYARENLRRSIAKVKESSAWPRDPLRINLARHKWRVFWGGVDSQRLARLLRETPRDWRIGIIDGGVIHLKNVTRKQALESCTNIRYAVRYVDDEQAFIAASDPNAPGHR